uniref:Uncharacterized protein n=1 Tax=Romanomermis culicivorax TaxID=13658 RepID=A0A915IUW1_ROMCU
MYTDAGASKICCDISSGARMAFMEKILPGQLIIAEKSRQARRKPYVNRRLIESIPFIYGTKVPSQNDS